MEQENGAPATEGDEHLENTGPVLFEDADDDAHLDVDPSLNQETPAAEDTPAAEEDELDTKETKRFSLMRRDFKGALKDKRRLERENEELRARIAPAAPTLPQKPTLDQFDYDEEKFMAATEDWFNKKRAVDGAAEQKRMAEQEEQRAQAKFRESYAERAQSLGVTDFQEAEQEVAGMLSEVQKGLLMRAPDDPATLVYALSKSPDRLIELSKITDLVKFTAALVRMESSLATRKPSRPAPETRMRTERSSTGFSTSGATLEKLRDEAARTGDFTKVVEFKRQQANK
jgi:hypothetical protein